VSDGTVGNVSVRGAILPHKFTIESTRDDLEQPGVALVMTLATGDSMTVAFSVRHAADLCLGLAQFLTPPDCHEEMH
jgi:hypothetical protein